MDRIEYGFGDDVKLVVNFGQIVDGDGEIVDTPSEDPVIKTTFVAQVFWKNGMGQFNCYPDREFKCVRDMKIDPKNPGIEELNPPPANVDRILDDFRALMAESSEPLSHSTALIKALHAKDPQLFPSQLSRGVKRRGEGGSPGAGRA